ncbi:non-hydrolyzing UDP-N-acetylglucosamine 2-epimerase [Clostridium luticellarii]|jgi:UDP-GlcNAc3NAcA epimerase|uniref:UDP-2,3-diacetamido-2,3-dideoxy-D-glucuronate 2-epimerase n=1 Tax=Clostridium luticellarii TaxID=1691940 RepID=A0A2T0BQY4_9CLOT|nr:UDP-N-acetylglucosamine 2-epimerase (non-hydrolyzing) [Clostridium luticellarii]MCI1944322.1 UDP-N-acetylglucosamine 2-epimerase (non-hydrolyzing) [Clostridium luticellarii]MCI1967818.1 UDP-N-acetylglucosamine 2-epimerase (non-hydrolyzing) [Clostridium luticellarii]MCI1994696.1 UDP-N-acetylglucosamine 2-epimerase (non-hydrolyzing) [Clostridium luticellarii]MCI2038807.1 UDP-N-acetylglucosamine 2-epimerase (non-hydrolyzing) [Clostridium luticellarii]PRR86290.1 UDP-2,3-diacetamido-2,3-dideoxy-
MKILTVVGARPQFIKAAAVSNILRKSHSEILVHTGQHYDENMSKVFFEELNIPKPDYNLGVGSGSHGKQTGTMLIKLEEIYEKEKPDVVLVYGDTNSTLAGALCASKLLIPVAHVEAGLRSFNMEMPEEQNRVLTDHVSNILFVPTKSAEENLKREGIDKGIYNVGDVMFDAILNFKKLAKNKNKIMKDLDLEGKEYILTTIHRAENTDHIDRLNNIVDALNECGRIVVLPLHPRTRKYMLDYGLEFNENVKVTDPVGYLEMINLEMNSQKIVTDSGGVQKEAFFMKKPCITMRDETEWVETVENGWNKIVGTDVKKILDGILNFVPLKEQKNIFGDGKASSRITKILDR